MEDYEGIVVSRIFRDLIFQEHAPERKQLCVNYVDNVAVSLLMPLCPKRPPLFVQHVEKVYQRYLGS